MHIDYYYYAIAREEQRRKEEAAREESEGRPDLSDLSWRPLVNPERRAEIPAFFPAPFAATAGTEPLLAGVREALGRRGLKLEDVPRITIVYPHKHPEKFPKHANEATRIAAQVQRTMAAAAPQTQWIMADGIVEDRHLDRSGDQSSFHALTGRQHYTLHVPSQREPLPFALAGAEGEKRERELALMVDTCCEQGSTIANFMSFLNANDADVFGVALGFTRYGTEIAQKRTDAGPHGAGLRGVFADAARNNGRAAELAAAFSQSARKTRLTWEPEECLDRFEAALNRCGNSLLALTDGECQRLRDTVSYAYHNGPVSFPDLVQKLERHASAREREALYGVRPPAP
jgi:hypothetical protein